MNRLNVYLSSPYMEFKDIRDKFLDEIQSRNKLYDITAMEDYLAGDKDVLSTCIADVNKCNIYVLVLGDKYGSIAKKNGEDSGKSFTYWEYDAANKKKNEGKDIERLILLKAGPSAADENPLFAAWKKEIAESQIQTVYYNDQEEIPQKILDSLDNFTLQRIQVSIQKKDVLRDKIYLCNRREINQEFLVSIDEDPIQFFVLSGHEDDLPHYFIKRKEIEFEDMSVQWKNIKIKPDIPDTVTEFEKAEIYIKSEIFNELKWKKFKLPKDVTPEGITQYMTENNLDYLSISWFIESILWKNDTLKEFIVSFYKKYNIINTPAVYANRISRKNPGETEVGSSHTMLSRKFIRQRGRRHTGGRNPFLDDMFLTISYGNYFYGVFALIVVEVIFERKLQGSLSDGCNNGSFKIKDIRRIRKKVETHFGSSTTGFIGIICTPVGRIGCSSPTVGQRTICKAVKRFSKWFKLNSRASRPCCQTGWGNV